MTETKIKQTSGISAIRELLNQMELQETALNTQLNALSIVEQKVNHFQSKLDNNSNAMSNDINAILHKILSLESDIDKRIESVREKIKEELLEELKPDIIQDNKSDNKNPETKTKRNYRQKGNLSKGNLLKGNLHWCERKSIACQHLRSIAKDLNIDDQIVDRQYSGLLQCFLNADMQKT